MAAELKPTRSAGKRKVSNLVRNLKAAIQYGEPNTTELKVKLEDAYDNLCDIDMQIAEIEETESNYLNEVSISIDNVLKLYHDSLKEDIQIKNNITATEKRKTIDRDFNDIHEITERIKGNISIEAIECTKMQRFEIEEDKSLLSDKVGCLVNEVSSLGRLVDVKELELKMDNVISVSNKVIRDSNVFLKLNQLELEESRDDASQIEGSNSTLLVKEGGPASSKEMPISEAQFASSSFLPTTDTGLSSASSILTSTDTGTAPSTLSTSMVALPTSHLPSSDAKPQSTSSTLSTGIHAQPASHFPSFDAKPQSASLYAQSSSMFTSSHQPHLATHFVSAGQSHIQTSFDPRAEVFYPTTSMNFSTSVVSAGQIRPATQVASTSVPMSFAYHYSPMSTIPSTSVDGYHRSSSDTIHTRRPSLPVFSGNRADWPEFKVVWRSLAEAQYKNPMQLAMELKRCCPKGRAGESLKNIYITREEAYGEMWKRLEEDYDDPGLSVQSAINQLMSIKSVGEEDYTGLVKCIDTIESVHNQLKELRQINAVHMVDIDRVSMRLPRDINMRWQRHYRDLDQSQRLEPFGEFLIFLRRERAVVMRIAESAVSAERKPVRKQHVAGSHVAATTKKLDNAKLKVYCVLHGQGHTTEKCKVFTNLSLKEKYDKLREGHHCFNCLGKHLRKDCKEPPCRCGKGHHKLLCAEKSEIHSNNTNTSASQQGTEDNIVVTKSLSAATGDTAIYPVHTVNLKGSKHPVTAFMDGGSNSSYITKTCAEKNKLKKIKTVSLAINTVGGSKTRQKSSLYEVPIVTKDKRVVVLTAYSLPVITNPTVPVDKRTIESLFPDFQVEDLVGPSREIDVLIGTDYFGLHPKTEIAKSGENLSIMSGELGGCLVGSHPQLNTENQVLYTEGIELIEKSTNLIQSHPGFKIPHSFIQGEEMGTETSPRCGGCKCGKCPMPGHTLSFQEEQELKMIQEGLLYDAGRKVWIASYPWLVSPTELPDNLNATKASLLKLESTLKRNPEDAETYKKQMTDLIQRGAARKLTKEELDEWEGPVYHISHLAVKNPKSTSTPVRIVFNSSQLYKGMSLNNCLAKGPDSYYNSIVGLLLRWREDHVALVADIKKMYHSVILSEPDVHCHRFLWRDLDINKEPEIYAIQRVNMGDRPAAAIATEALRQTAEKCKDTHQKAAEFILNSSYMDDLIDSVATSLEAKQLAQDTNAVLQVGNFFIKCWQFSFLDHALDANAQDAKASLLKGSVVEETAVLGVNWNPVKDNMKFHASLNFSPKVRGVTSGPDLTKEEVPKLLPHSLTRRMVLRQVMSIYDPLGIVSPFTLKAKILLRKTWELQLGWDQPMPQSLQRDWTTFFVLLYKLEEIEFERVLRPKEPCDSPWLILYSDGSELAYGFVAFIRWRLKSGGYWCRMIMSKNRIAPMQKTTIPRMELNGAVLSKRGRVVIEKEMRIKFERVLHLIDSQTVLNMINKCSTRFKLYEGTRIGEIQKATSGDMSEWAWLPGSNNIADCITRGLNPDKISENSEWWNGPPMLYTEFDTWDIKFGTPETEKLSGEMCCLTKTSDQDDSFPFQVERFSQIKKLKSVMVRVLGIAKTKSFRGGRAESITPELYQLAESLLIKETQKDLKDQVSKNFKCLNPKQNDMGIIVVGSRMSKFNPMTLDGKEQALLPNKHPITKLLMAEAHQMGHLGRDSTVAKFRQKYWTPHADKLAKSVKHNCQKCKKREPKLLSQCMGNLPESRLKMAPPFSHTMLDLLGPFLTRGEVQKRTSGKCYFILFTDLGSRALHLECVFGYSTDHFLIGFSRFVHIRGWPTTIYSDPGSQLIGADRELTDAWKQMDKGRLIQKSASAGTKWIFGAADSPWHQGAAESLVKTVKKCLQFAVHSQRLSPAEYLSVAYEVANLVNERPIGHRPALDSSITILTPNMLLLGRSTANNTEMKLPVASSLTARFTLVQSVSDEFWRRWTELYAPSMVRQNKWLKQERDLVPGDIVLVSERGYKGSYTLGQVHETFLGTDGKVRKVNLRYKRLKNNEPAKEYHGAKDIIVSRAVQRLALIVPMSEQDF